MKYIKLKSVSFWSAMVPLASGLFVATLPIHGLFDAVASVNNATGLTAPELVTIGIGGIGFRGAMK